MYHKVAQLYGTRNQPFYRNYIKTCKKFNQKPYKKVNVITVTLKWLNFYLRPTTVPFIVKEIWGLQMCPRFLEHPVLRVCFCLPRMFLKVFSEKFLSVLFTYRSLFCACCWCFYLMLFRRQAGVWPTEFVADNVWDMVIIGKRQFILKI